MCSTRFPWNNFEIMFPRDYLHWEPYYWQLFPENHIDAIYIWKLVGGEKGSQWKYVQ
jgi:hypothetical protein